MSNRAENVKPIAKLTFLATTSALSPSVESVLLRRKGDIGVQL